MEGTLVLNDSGEGLLEGHLPCCGLKLSVKGRFPHGDISSALKKAREQVFGRLRAFNHLSTLAGHTKKSDSCPNCWTSLLNMRVVAARDAQSIG